MEKKYTKKQKDAIDGIRYNLDELDNKPRRLYSALREFVDAFLDKDRKQTAKIMARIDQAETSWYTQWDFENIVASILSGIRRRGHELTSTIAYDKFCEDRKRWDEKATDKNIEEAWRYYKDGVKDMEKQSNKVVFHNTYPELDDSFERYS